jgi:hypothetical protein
MAEDIKVKEHINVRSSAAPRSLVREWRLKSYWSEYIPQCSLLWSRVWKYFLTVVHPFQKHLHHTMWR